MNIYMEELTGAERDSYIEYAICNNTLNQCYTMLEMVGLKYEQMCQDAELKVLQESGSYDDLAFLYQEAEAQADEESKGILQKAWEAICSFFKGIKDFLFGKGKEIPDNTQIELPSNIAEVCANIEGVFKNPVANIPRILTTVVVSGSTVTIGALTLNSAVKKFTKSDGITFLNKIQGVLNSGVEGLKSLIDLAKNSISGLVKDKLGIDLKLPDGVSKFLNIIMTPIHAVGNVIKTKINEAGAYIQNKFSGPKTTEQNRAQNQKDINKQTKAVVNSKTEQEKQKNMNRLQNSMNKEKFYQRMQQNRQRAQNQVDSDTGNQANKIIRDYANIVSYYVQGDTMYRLFGNGTSKPLSQREVSQVPKGIRHQLGFESADDEVIDASTIRQALGSNYTVEVCENGDALKITFIGENVEDDVLNVMEPEIPIQESIFGVDCSDEETTESYSDIEKELLELESIFE